PRAPASPRGSTAGRRLKTREPAQRQSPTAVERTGRRGFPRVQQAPTPPPSGSRLTPPSRVRPTVATTDRPLLRRDRQILADVRFEKLPDMPCDLVYVLTIASQVARSR